MKKVILALAILCMVFIAENTKAQGIGVGIKAGANFANQSITDISTNSKTGFHGGAYVVLAFSEKWAIQPEILYSAQGAELPDEISEFNYISIPVLLRWKPMSLLSFEAGPQFSMLKDAIVDDEDIKDQIKNSDFGMALGATVHLPLGFNGGIRYVWGLSNIWDSDIEDITVKNSVVQVYAGWTIFGAK